VIHLPLPRCSDRPCSCTPVTEDYSSYESVNEEEPELGPPAKSKGRRKSVAVNKEDGGVMESTTGDSAQNKNAEDARPRKGVGSGKAAGQKALTSFFSKYSK